MKSAYSPYRHSRLEGRPVRNPNSVTSTRFSRKGTYLFATVLSVAMVFAFCVDFVLQGQRFPTKYIDVVGDHAKSTTDQIVKAVAEVSTGNILLVDIAKAAEAAQSFSWVEKATIRRKWPDTLEVQINTRKVQARWGEDEYLDQFGTPFTMPIEVTQKLPMLSGPRSAAPEILEAYDSWKEPAKKVGLEIKSIKLSGRGSWEVHVSPLGSTGTLEQVASEPAPIKVIMGSTEVKDRSNRFLKLYADIFRPVSEMVATVDLRYRDGVSVTWKGTPPQIHGTQTILNTENIKS